MPTVESKKCMLYWTRPVYLTRYGLSFTEYICTRFNNHYNYVHTVEMIENILATIKHLSQEYSQNIGV